MARPNKFLPRVARYGVRLTFVGGKRPMMLAAYETREEAREFARHWTLETLWRRLVPEAADQVEVFRTADQVVVFALLISHGQVGGDDAQECSQGSPQATRSVHP
jgi:hypothetical protein